MGRLSLECVKDRGEVDEGVGPDQGQMEGAGPPWDALNRIRTPESGNQWGKAGDTRQTKKN